MPTPRCFILVGAVASPAELLGSVRKYLDLHTAEWSTAREFLVRKVLEMLDYSKCVKSQELTDRLDIRRHYNKMLEEGVLALVLRGAGRERCVMVTEDLERHFKGYLPKALEDFLERFKEENRAKIREVLERIAKGERLSWGEFKYGDSVIKYALAKARESGLLWYVEVGGRKGRGFFMINPLLYKE
jgi:predicted house-cleaning noncanonical NTP pyrophosphatase (MazG superfamily)